VELMWLCKKLRPDHKTIAHFRRDHLKPPREVCRAFTLLCKQLDLFGGALVAIDGSKFGAVNAKGRHFTKAKLGQVIAQIDERGRAISKSSRPRTIKTRQARRGVRAAELPT
jgi:hypothetical protein